VTENGHAPEIIDLGEILDETRPARTVRLPHSIDRGSVTAYELSLIGRALDITPAELDAAVRGGGWEAVDLQIAFVWVILRRREPDLTLEEVQTFGLDMSPDPTLPVKTGTLRRRGSAGSSISVAPPASHPVKSEG
jgi:hypothetical protein